MKRQSTGRKLRDKGAIDFDGYLAALPADARGALENLRKLIRAAAPRAEEGSSYGLPAFKLDGKPLVCFAAATNHLSFHPMSGDIIKRHAADLKGYETSKGTVRFSPDKPMTATLVRKLVKARMEEIAQPRASQAKTSREPKPHRRSVR